MKSVFKRRFPFTAGQVFDQGFWPGFLGIENAVHATTGVGKYNIQCYWDGEVQFSSSTGTEKNQTKIMY